MEDKSIRLEDIKSTVTFSAKEFEMIWNALQMAKSGSRNIEEVEDLQMKVFAAFYFAS